jgi:hypothetical protein
MEAINPSDHSAAMNALIDETSRAINWLNEVIGTCVSTCLRLHVGEFYSLGPERVTVQGAPGWGEHRDTLLHRGGTDKHRALSMAAANHCMQPTPQPVIKFAYANFSPVWRAADAGC